MKKEFIAITKHQTVERFNAESICDVLEDNEKDDYANILTVENVEDAEKIATSYSGECKNKVRSVAWRILAENGKWEDVKKTEIENLVKNEEISAEFSKDGNVAKVTYLGDWSKFEKDEFGEWGEWFGKVLHLLDIEGDDDMTNYLFECLEKKDANNEKK